MIAVIALLGGTFFFFGQRFSGKTAQFSQSVTSANPGKAQKVVTLKNGDTFDLKATVVKHTINGTPVKMLAYNGSIPGPLITVPQGAEITLHFTNNTDVDSTIHPHGVRVANAFDGVAGITQDPVKPGQSYTYTLTFPDAGVFWYHPHIREDYAQELGLYGNIVVTPNTKHYWSEVDRQEALFLDDILLVNGSIAPFSRDRVDHTLMGRFGNTMLVNGSPQYKTSVRQGERVRFYLTNAANTRVFNVAVANTKMKLVGSDNGKYEREEWVDRVMIGPSERQIVEIGFDTPGEFQLQHQTPERTYTLGTITVTPAQVASSNTMTLRTNQDVIASIDPFRPYFDKPADKDLTLSLRFGSTNSVNGEDSGGHMMGNGQMMPHQQMRMGESKKIEWEDDMGMMNAQSTKDSLRWLLRDQATKAENMDINWQFKTGDVVKIRVFNDDTSLHPMQHPIHIHGQKFLVLSTNGKKHQNLVWKDTTLIQTGDTVELLVQMDNPGKWMIHCHIPEHMESGMMSAFEVL